MNGIPAGLFIPSSIKMTYESYGIAVLSVKPNTDGTFTMESFGPEGIKTQIVMAFYSVVHDTKCKRLTPIPNE